MKIVKCFLHEKSCSLCLFILDGDKSVENKNLENCVQYARCTIGYRVWTRLIDGYLPWTCVDIICRIYLNKLSLSQQKKMCCSMVLIIWFTALSQWHVFKFPRFSALKIAYLKFCQKKTQILSWEFMRSIFMEAFVLLVRIFAVYKIQLWQ